MNRSAKLLTSILTISLIATATGGSPAKAAVQAPATVRSAAVAITPEAPALTSSTATPAMASTAVSGTSCTPSCELWARPGTLALPGGATVPVWGYATGTDTFHPVTVPGPTLTVIEGDAAQIILHNDLAEASSIAIPGSEALIPDTTGAASGSSTTYTFTAGALKAGTYLYEAGMTPGGPRQVAMGLVGALIVRPATLTAQAYDTAATGYDDEAVLVLTEVDPAFNAAPTTFELNTFSPKYWLINGKGYPDTDVISTAAGHRVLLRYVNAGLISHSMGLLGLHQQVIATDANLLANPRTLVAETVGAGGTLDTIATIPLSAHTGAKYALMDAAMRVDNNGILTPPATATSTVAFGGMLTFLSLDGTLAAGGPTTAVTATPNATNGSTAVGLTATITPTAAQTASAAEYFLDSIGAGGTGCPMTLAGSTASATIATTGGAAPCVDLASLASGTHTVYVHAQDSGSATLWGSFGATTFNLDRTGPLVANIVLAPSHANGTVNVTLSATASDLLTGNHDIDQAEFFIDTLGASGSGTAVAVSPMPTVTVSLDATIPASRIATLSEGTHTIYVSAHDVFGNWGTSSATLVVDKTGPTASAVATTPSPTNGTFGVLGGSTGAYQQRLDATFTDTASTIATAEYFLDAVTANGSGYPMIPADGAYNSASEVTYQFLDLYGIAALTEGQHTIYVHAKDAAGNWGNALLGAATFIVDKTGPNITGAALNPDPNTGAASVTLTATATDPSITGVTYAPAVTAAEWFLNTDPATAITVGAPAQTVSLSATIDVSALPAGLHGASIRAYDLAHNWGPVATVPFTISPTVTAVSPNSGPTAGNTLVTILGTKFAAPAIVRVDGVLATAVNVLDATTIRFRTPAHAAGTVNVTVTVAGQTSAISNANRFTYGGPAPAAPVVDPVAPAAGGSAPAAPAAQAPSLAPSTLALRARPGGLQPAPFVIPGADAYHAEWVAQSAYPTATAGQLVEWVVAFKNTGSAGWYRGMLGANAALGSSQPLNNETAAQLGMDPGNWQYASRFSVQTTDYVAPGQTGWFVLQVKAPTTAGTYRISLRPVIDGVSWMEDYGVYFDLTVK